MGEYRCVTKKTKNNGTTGTGMKPSINETGACSQPAHALPRGKMLAAMGGCAVAFTVG